MVDSDGSKSARFGPIKDGFADVVNQVKAIYWIYFRMIVLVEPWVKSIRFATVGVKA